MKLRKPREQKESYTGEDYGEEEQQEEEIGEQGEWVDESSEDQVSGQKPGGRKLIVAVTMGLIIMVGIVGVVLVGVKSKRVPEKPVEVVGDNEYEQDEQQGEGQENGEDKGSGGDEDTKEEEKQEDTRDEGGQVQVERTERRDYEGSVLGLGFDYETDMYLRENTEGVFNRMKEVAKKGKNFDIRVDQIGERMEIVRLTTGEDDNLDVRVYIEGKDTTTEEVLTDQEGNEIQQGVEYIEETYTSETNKGDKLVVSERKYTNEDGSVLEYMSGEIETGANKIVVRVMSDGSPLKVDKYKLFEKIIKTIEVREIENTEEVVVEAKQSGVYEYSVDLEVVGGQVVEQRGER